MSLNTLIFFKTKILIEYKVAERLPNEMQKPETTYNIKFI